MPVLAEDLGEIIRAWILTQGEVVQWLEQTAAAKEESTQGGQPNIT